MDIKEKRETTGNNASSDLTLGRIIRKERQAMGLTQKQFITRLGVKISPTYLTKLEQDLSLPSPQLAKRIALVIGIDVNYVFEKIISLKTHAYIIKLRKGFAGL